MTGYSTHSKAYRVFNKRSQKVEELFVKIFLYKIQMMIYLVFHTNQQLKSSTIKLLSQTLKSMIHCQS
ncbi:hypothetical protein LINGRAHAP2_LOCUS29103, partial [Linum grandiflorum]